MKLIISIIVLAMSIVTLSFAKDNKKSHYNEKLCKIFTLKTEMYKKHMRNDAYAQATLESYKNRAKLYCTK